MQSNLAEIRLKFLGDDFDYGDIGLWHFHFHSLTPRLRDKRWRCFAESDWGVWYHYNWHIAEEWTLSGRILPRWLTLPYWHSNPSTIFEWHLLFSLDNPYLTPSLLMRRGIIPTDYLYFQVGLSKRLPLMEDLSFEPGVYVDVGDQCLLRKDFGELPDGGRYGSNFGSLQFRFPFSYRLTENLTLVAKIEQMVNVNEEARKYMSGCGKKEWTIFSIGLDARF